MFDAFHQAGRNDASQVGGLGLGLAITKGLVELHGGRVEVASEGLDRGATFRVLIPSVDAVEDPRQTGEWEPVSVPPDGPVRVLLVDDHDDTLALLEMALRRHGYEVVTASTVEEGLEAARREDPDVLVSDIGLPDGSGTELMRRLNSDDAGMRGIALTGFGSEADIVRSRRAGFREHLTKPVRVQQLLSAIDRLL